VCDVRALKTYLAAFAAERAAVRHLRSRGFTIIERNVRLGRDEIDAVAIHAGYVVFVEVRYRSGGATSGLLSIDRGKAASMRRAARAYRARERLWNAPARIDVVGVGRADGRWLFDHRMGVISG
jgi:putative endonuclease